MLWRTPEMVAPRGLVFRPLIKGSEALAWVSISMHSCGSVPIVMVLRLASGHRSSAKNACPLQLFQKLRFRFLRSGELERFMCTSRWPRLGERTTTVGTKMGHQLSIALLDTSKLQKCLVKASFEFFLTEQKLFVFPELSRIARLLL